MKSPWSSRGSLFKTWSPFSGHRKDGYSSLETGLLPPSPPQEASFVVRRMLRTRAKSIIICSTIPIVGLILWVTTMQCRDCFSWDTLSSPFSDPPPPTEGHFEKIDWPVGKDDKYIPYKDLYLVFREPDSASAPPVALTETRRLPAKCMDSYFSAGDPCYDGLPTKFDVVWTWVNGSDPYFKKAKVKGLSESLIRTPALQQMYRNHDELRHSFRSVLQHFHNHTRNLHLITHDFPLQTSPHTETSTQQRYHLGILPTWLDPNNHTTWKDGDVGLNVQYHSQYFKHYSGPVFNSYGIESQFPYLRNVSENFLYMNDDFFLTASLSPSDFYTSSYGIVLRMQPDLVVEPTGLSVPSSGEWLPLRWTSRVISKRFGYRARPYIVHVTKSLSMPLLQEMALIWEPELRRTAGHKFRGMRTNGGADAYMAFMFGTFVVERWREALLWTWVVAHVGGENDEWREFEKIIAWTEVGGSSATVLDLNVALQPRDTLDEERIAKRLRDAGEAASRTKYVFSSGDGYPFDYMESRTAAKPRWPKFTKEFQGKNVCRLNFAKCFGSASRASDAFKIIAFERPLECGDCIIHALRAASGKSGLSAFIPPPSRMINVPHSSERIPEEEDFMKRRREEHHGQYSPEGIPHLPLVADWHKGDFTLRGVIGSDKVTNVRSWTLRLLERYRFVIGETPSEFIMVTSAVQARASLSKIDASDGVALVCINDDVKIRPELADRIVRTWLDRRFLNAAHWERQ